MKVAEVSWSIRHSPSGLPDYENIARDPNLEWKGY
jgi:hypothetical protein